jgi:hypothetical protein
MSSDTGVVIAIKLLRKSVEQVSNLLHFLLLSRVEQVGNLLHRHCHSEKKNLAGVMRFSAALRLVEWQLEMALAITSCQVQWRFTAFADQSRVRAAAVLAWRAFYAPL